MKLKTNLLLCALMLIGSWTASSQITGISRQQKIEVVSTLETYPIILKELDLHYEMLQRCELLQEIYKKDAKQCDDQLVIKNAIQARLESQKELLEKQLKRKNKSGWIVPVLIGLAGGTVLGVSL